MEFHLIFTPEASQVLAEVEGDANYTKKHKKVLKTLGRIQVDPQHPGLRSHEFESLSGPNGEKVWESYVENRTPGAWRIYWWYGPERGQITILTLGPHPD